MRNYDMTTTADIFNRLSRYSGYNYTEETKRIKKWIGADFYNAFQEELFDTLESRDYDSNTVVGDSLTEAGNNYFKPMNYQIRRAMKKDSNTMSRAALIRKYTGRNYKTADDKMIKKYAYYLYALNNVNFYFSED